MEEIKRKWQELNFEVKSYRAYKDKFILGKNFLKKIKKKKKF